MLRTYANMIIIWHKYATGPWHIGKNNCRSATSDSLRSTALRHSVSGPGTSEAQRTLEHRYNLRSRNIRSKGQTDGQPQSDNHNLT
jgi:hypothetical protein